MRSCKEITELAADYADDALVPEARRQLEAHLASCPGCRTWLDQLDVTARAIRALPPPALPAGLQDQLLLRFDAWQAGRSVEAVPGRAVAAEARGRYAWEALVALVGVMALLVALARHPSRALADLIVSAGLAAGAILLARLARRLTPRFAVAAVSAALVAAAVRGGPGPLELSEGLECLAIEGAAAAVVAGAAWISARRTKGAVSLGPWAVAGALAGAAVLQLACGAHTSLAHLVTFHAGGVLLVAALALVGTRRQPQPA
jgi:hypothetical protein